jgi:hypothetical protein
MEDRSRASSTASDSSIASKKSYLDVYEDPKQSDFSGVVAKVKPVGGPSAYSALKEGAKTRRQALGLKAGRKHRKGTKRHAKKKSHRRRR